MGDGRWGWGVSYGEPSAPSQVGGQDMGGRQSFLSELGSPWPGATRDQSVLRSGQVLSWRSTEAPCGCVGGGDPRAVRALTQPARWRSARGSTTPRTACAMVQGQVLACGATCQRRPAVGRGGLEDTHTGSHAGTVGSDRHPDSSYCVQAHGCLLCGPTVCCPRAGCCTRPYCAPAALPRGPTAWRVRPVTG